MSARERLCAAAMMGLTWVLSPAAAIMTIAWLLYANGWVNAGEFVASLTWALGYLFGGCGGVVGWLIVTLIADRRRTR